MISCILRCKNWAPTFFYIGLIENCPCSPTDELRAREGKWIKELGSMNMRIAGRSGKHPYAENKEKDAVHGKTRYENTR